MAPSTAHTRISMTSSIRRPTALSRVHRHRNVPARSLWWWGRHGTWSTATEESLEERIQRHQKIMRHRYSRALRRRAMWDRDDSPPSWLYRVPDGRPGHRWGPCRTMSSTDNIADKSRERQNELPHNGDHPITSQNAAKNYHRDFESFKAAVDRAIDRDPYGTLFGRRMQSPPTDNNASWISWLFARDETPQQTTNKPSDDSSRRKIEIEVLDRKMPSPSPKLPLVSKAFQTTDPLPQDTTLQAEYVYDPISGRRVPKSSPIIDTSPQAKQSLLQALFSEHGNSTPDQMHKHQKVHHRALPQKPELGTEEKAAVPKTAFESSRKHEYQQLRAATLGNHIDTTAEFGGKVGQVSDPGIEPVQERKRSMSEPDNDAPLFLGTTYESKLVDTASVPHERAVSWLVKEGFQIKDSSTVQPQKKTNSSANRLEPSFERMQSVSESNSKKRFTSKLQPAIDRVQRTKAPEPPRPISKPFDVTSPASPAKPLDSVPSSVPSPKEEMREDVDLLRASDIRAATKSARTTKHDVVQAKTAERSKLENAFNQLQQGTAEEPISDATQLRANSDKLSRSIESVRRHAEQYSDGIVARTLRSMGVLGDSDKQLGETPKAEEVDLAKRIDHSGAGGVLEHEEANKAHRWELLRESQRNANEIRLRDDKQIVELASNILQSYEAERGPIDLSLAQSSAREQVKDTAMVATLPEAKDAVSIIRHQPPVTSLEFFAERARFLKEVNQIAASVAIIKSKTAQLEVDMSNESITSSEATQQVDKLTTEAGKIAHKTSVLEIEADKLILQDATKTKHPHPLNVATVKSGVSVYPEIERHTKVFEPRYIQILYAVKAVRSQLQEVSASVHDLKRSRRHHPIKNAVPTIESSMPPQATQPSSKNVHKEQTLTSASPYLILVYNKATGEVDQTVMDRLPWAQSKTVEKTNPIKIMGSLNYPAAFVTHFVQLEKAGYELSSGGGDMLVFQKKTVSTPEGNPAKAIMGGPPLKPATRALRNTIATAEASAQPEITETIAQPRVTTPKEAATVLDEIPTEIPTPGPAAPTAPQPSSHIGRTPRPGPKVTRQEAVFSATRPLRSAKSPPQPTSPPRTDESQDPNFFSRTARTLRRGVLGVAAFGATAYLIGAVAEGIGAQAQADTDATLGPRTKVVMPVGQRAGIYSTESSRD